MGNSSIHVIPGQTIFATDCVPKFFYINAITKDFPCVVTFTEDHDYKIGQFISFRVANPYGMFQMNNLRGKVLDLTSNSVTVNIDTRQFGTFIYPVSGNNTPPVSVPAGSGTVPADYVATVTLADAFDNLRT